MNTILVPTDFSYSADNAQEYAIALAKRIKAKLLLVNAYLLPYVKTAYPREYIGDEIKHAELSSHHHLKMRCNYIRETYGIKCDYVGEFGDPPKVILEIIKKKKPVLVVMGTHGASGLKAAFLGTNTARVIGKSAAPVLAIPVAARYKEIKNIVFTSDLHKSDIGSLQNLLQLLKSYTPNIRVTHLYDGEFIKARQPEFDKFRERAVKEIRYKSLSYKLLHVTNPLHELEKFSRSRSSDLLVMSTHRRSMIERLLNKSLSKKIALRTRIPLLVMRHKENAEVVI